MQNNFLFDTELCGGTRRIRRPDLWRTCVITQTAAFVRRGVAVAVLLFSWNNAAWTWQQQPETAAPSGIALADVKAFPGASVMLPLSYVPDPNKPVRSLTVEIDYVSNSLTFQSTSPGLAAELADASIQSNLSDLPADPKGLKRSRLKVVVALKAPKPKGGLPEGLFAYLLFQIADSAKPFTVKMNAAIAAAEDLFDPPRRVAGLAAQPGSVTIENPDSLLQELSPELKPDVGCFFFTH